jgi:DNA topoisomerase-1
VTDGVTNASLSKNAAPEEVTLEFALRMLAERAAAGPPKKKPARRSAPRRKVASKAE